MDHDVLAQSSAPGSSGTRAIPHNRSGAPILRSRPDLYRCGLSREPLPEMAEFLKKRTASPEDDEHPAQVVDGQWQLRADVSARIKNKIETALPEEAPRAAVLTFLAFAIENADEERENHSGFSRRSRRGLACELAGFSPGTFASQPCELPSLGRSQTTFGARSVPRSRTTRSSKQSLGRSCSAFRLVVLRSLSTC